MKNPKTPTQGFNGVPVVKITDYGILNDEINCGVPGIRYKGKLRTLIPLLMVGGVCSIAVYGGYRFVKMEFDGKQKKRDTDEKLRFLREKIKIEVANKIRAKDSGEESLCAEPEPDPVIDNGNLQGHSTDELFKSINDIDTNWVIDGLMVVGQISLLVAGAGAGKTNFLMQTARAVAKGIRPEYLPDSGCRSTELPVIYYRLEDFKGELQGKYGDGEAFHDSNIQWFLPEDLTEFTLSGFIAHIKNIATQMTEDKLVCIDPATKLSGYQHLAFIQGVEEAMGIAEQRGYTLTPVAAIHLDEIKMWSPLSACDIKGGDKAIQQAGSVIALRHERRTDDYRFLQCLKPPKGYPTPFDGKVLVIKSQIERLDENNKYIYYQYDSIRSETEARPLKPKAEIPPKIGSTNSARPKAPNQKLTAEDDELLAQWYSEGIIYEEMQRRLKKMKKKVNIKTIKRHIAAILKNEE